MSIFASLLGKQFNILKYLPQAILIIDETGKIHYANKSAQKLFETVRIKDKNINDYFIINFENIIKNIAPLKKQVVKLVTEEQNTRITDVNVVDISSKKDKRYILSIVDNTEEHLLLDSLVNENQEKKILNRSKNLLLSKMDNYLTSPLHSVVGFSQAMLSGLSGDLNEKQRKYLEIINSNSSELLLFIQKLVELSKVESDIYNFEYANFDIASLVSVIINEFKVKIGNKDIKMSLNSEELPNTAIYSDKNVIKNIITNIIENVSEQIETGAIHIRLSNPDSEFLFSKGLEIDDNTNKSYIMIELLCRGIDTSLYNTKDFFDPYVQVDQNSKKYLLQSLLLSCAQKYIHKMKGEVWFINQTSNQVSFVVVIPYCKASKEV